jgi:hypothetical protein
MGLAETTLLSRLDGATCAAEMKDKQEVFRHLVNTSLLTAPINFANKHQAEAATGLVGQHSKT